MISPPQENDRDSSLVWPIFFFSIALGIPFGGWIRAAFGDSVVGRLTVQDGMFLLLFLIVGMRIWHFKFTRDIWLVGMVNLGIVLSILGNNSPGWNEAVIHLYLFFLYFIFRNLLVDQDLRRSLHLGLIVAFGFAFLTAIAAKIVSVPLLPQHSLHLQGSFLNGSQYGSFMLVVMVPLFATFFVRFISRAPSEEFLPLKWVYQRVLPMICLLAPLLVLFSSKRAALLSMMVSLILAFGVILVFKSVRTLKGMLGLLILLVLTGLLVNEVVGERVLDLSYFISRMSSGLSQIDSKDHFFVQNIKHAWSAFIANPLLGSGYGGLGFNYGGEDYEIHSTYLKWLGSGGLVTAVPGLLLVMLTGHSLYRIAVGPNKENRMYALFLLIFFLGLVIAMVYSYLPRRREFWVILAYLNAFAAQGSIRCEPNPSPES